MGDGILYQAEIIRSGVVIDTITFHNAIPQQAVDYVVGVSVAGEAQILDWRVGLIGAPFVESVSLRTSDIGGSLSEIQTYSETLRPRFIGVRVANEYDNVSSKAEFTITADCTMCGAFVSSSSQKGSSSGVLLSVASYQTPRDLKSGDVVSMRAAFAIDPKV